ncbi:hypothetical protein EB796_019081 [Bugula neritina]|uniref:Uncharacterized protein n=1 Tax=Bugula neritina TaxID=10212 RepID=A0A7J7JA91_BUGNE|nr:hypothetical protein EB796_019081 [Bugula neritina]
MVSSYVKSVLIYNFVTILRSSPVVATAIFFSTQQPEPISAAYKLQEYRVERFLGRGKAALFGVDRSRII